MEDLRIKIEVMTFTFPKLLEHHFLVWQQTLGGRRSVGQFAEWLGFPQSTLSTWWTGKSEPKDERIIRQLAKKLGIEVYDALGLSRPDENFYYIDSQWEYLSESEQIEIRKTIEERMKKKKK